MKNEKINHSNRTEETCSILLSFVCCFVYLSTPCFYSIWN